jgi:hypothetical protein
MIKIINFDEVKLDFEIYVNNEKFWIKFEAFETFSA